MAGKTLERRRGTPQNRAVRRTIEVLEWAAGLPPDECEEGQGLMRQAHRDAITALRQERPAVLSALGLITPLHWIVAVALFALGLGLGLTFGGTAN
jgi:hypothetical protein